ARPRRPRAVANGAGAIISWTSPYVVLWLFRLCHGLPSMTASLVARHARPRPTPCFSKDSHEPTAPPPRRDRRGAARLLSGDAAIAAAAGGRRRFHRARGAPARGKLPIAGRLGPGPGRGAGRLSPAGKPDLRALSLCGRPGRQRGAARRPLGRPAAAGAGRHRARRGLPATGAGHRPGQRPGAAVLLPPGPADRRDPLQQDPGQSILMSILRITCSPRGAASESHRLAQAIIGRIACADAAAAESVVEVDAGRLPHVAPDYAAALCAAADPAGPVAERGSLGLSSRLIASLAQADYVVIATPMHNFTVPSALKAWIDHVVRVRHT